MYCHGTSIFPSQFKHFSFCWIWYPVRSPFIFLPWSLFVVRDIHIMSYVRKVFRFVPWNRCSSSTRTAVMSNYSSTYQGKYHGYLVLWCPIHQGFTAVRIFVNLSYLVRFSTVFFVRALFGETLRTPDTESPAGINDWSRSRRDPRTLGARGGRSIYFFLLRWEWIR